MCRNIPAGPIQRAKIRRAGEPGGDSDDRSNRDMLRGRLTVQLWCNFSMLKRAYLGNSVPICAYRPLKNPCKYKGNMAPALGIEPRT